MTPVEIGSVAGAAFVAGGAVITFVNKLIRKNNSDFQREQTMLLTEIRDAVIKLGYEISTRFSIQADKLSSISDSISSVHSRLNGRVNRVP